jgi:hypothetical protein
MAEKKTQRRANDSYQTPPEIVAPLLDLVDWSRVRSFLEPCRGDGHIFDAAESAIAFCDVIDGPRPPPSIEWCELRDGRDYFDRPPFPVDLIITNPPFTLALEFLRKSLEEAATVIYLLPLGFLSSTERREFWAANPPTNLITISKRPCFVWVCAKRDCHGSAPPGTPECPACGGRLRRQTDFSDVGWYVWDRGRMLTTRAPFVWI